MVIFQRKASLQGSLGLAALWFMSIAVMPSSKSSLSLSAAAENGAFHWTKRSFIDECCGPWGCTCLPDTCLVLPDVRQNSSPWLCFFVRLIHGFICADILPFLQDILLACWPSSALQLGFSLA
jgi:hypothetical protein